VQLRVDRTVLALLVASILLCLLTAFCLFGGYGLLSLGPFATPTMSLVESVRATATAEALEIAAQPIATSTPSPTQQPTTTPTFEPLATDTPAPTVEPVATDSPTATTQPRPTNTPVPTPTNTPKPPAPTTLSRGPYLQSVTPHSITIVWETAQEVDSVVEYGPTAAYDSRASDYTWTTRHEVTLTGLSPYTTYHYRVGTSTQVLSDDGAFKTAAGPGQTSFTFAVLGETNSGIDPVEFEDLRRSADAGHRASVVALDGINPDFYLHTGNLVRTGSDMAAWDDFFSFEGDLMSRITMFPTLGEREENHVNYFDLFSLPNNERWYSFDYGNAHLISLQIDGYGDISPGSEQYRWLENDLANTDKTWKFAFFSYPPYSYGPSGSKPEARPVHPLFVQYGVDVVFSANDRNYQRFTVEGVTYIVTGGGGARVRRLSGGSEYPPIYMEKIKHVMRVTVSGSTLSSVAIKFDPGWTEFDPFTLTAS
jgi:hypothetical protein